MATFKEVKQALIKSAYKYGIKVSFIKGCTYNADKNIERAKNVFKKALSDAK